MFAGYGDLCQVDGRFLGSLPIPPIFSSYILQIGLKNNNAIKIYVLYLWQSVKQYLNVSKYCLTDSILEKSRKNEI